MYDCIIIGGGVIGCSVARFLSRYEGKFCLLEWESDIACGTTKANSAIIHAGFDAAFGSKMAAYNVRGSRMMPELAEELDIPFKRNGSLVVCLSREDLPKLHALYENGVKNGVEGLRILDAGELHAMEPNVAESAVAALYAPTGGIVCPFRMTQAFAENAAANGVEFKLSTVVRGVSQCADGTWQVETESGVLRTKTVVNCAGVYSAVFHNQVSARKLHIIPRRGDYCLLDKSAGNHVKCTVFQLPGAKGKGVLVTPTVHGNLLVGPTAVDVDDFEATATTAEGLSQLIAKAGSAVRDIPMNTVITSFAGLRAHEDGHEFILGEVPDAEGFFDCAGIESPGLSCAPAIGLDTADRVAEKLALGKKTDFIPTRRGIPDARDLSFEERAELVRKQPAYGQIICRCEGISEGEILDAIHRTPGATDVDGVKRRVRAGMGRCQGGFCSPRVMEILARELGKPMNEITKTGAGSAYIAGRTKEADHGKL